jgi:hypothetical protein
MTITVEGAQLTELFTMIAVGPTTVYTAAKRTTITAIVVCPTNATPNLSISRYDGTTRRFIRKAVAMTAGTAFVWDTPFVLDPGEVLEVTSSSPTGDMDVMTTFLNPDAPSGPWRPTAGA